MFSKIFTTVKYLLVAVNFLFLITGIIVLAVGSNVQAAYNQYHEFLVERFFSLPAFCIATGVIIFLIAFAGFYGALMENYTVNMAFAGAMVLIFIFQLATCIAGYALRGNTLALIQQQLTATMDLYPDNVSVTKMWDEMQRDFECCGVLGPADWPSHFNKGDATADNDGGVPVSCCLPIAGTVQTFNCNVTSSNIFSQGCGPAFGTWVQGHATAIGVAGIFLVLMQACAVAGAVYIAQMSRQDSYLP